MSPYGALNESIQRLLKAHPYTLNDLIRTAKQSGLTPAHARRVVDSLVMGGKVTSKHVGVEMVISWIEGDV